MLAFRRMGTIYVVAQVHVVTFPPPSQRVRRPRSEKGFPDGYRLILHLVETLPRAKKHTIFLVGTPGP